MVTPPLLDGPRATVTPVIRVPLCYNQAYTQDILKWMLLSVLRLRYVRPFPLFYFRRVIILFPTQIMTQNISSLQSELLELFNPKQDENDTQTPADTITDILINPESTTDKISLQGGKNISEMVGNILAGGDKSNESNQKPSETISDILLSNSPNNESDTANDNNSESDSESANNDSSDSDSDSDDYISLIHEFRGSPKTQLTGGSTTQTVKIIPFFPYVLKA